MLLNLPSAPAYQKYRYSLFFSLLSLSCCTFFNMPIVSKVNWYTLMFSPYYTIFLSPCVQPKLHIIIIIKSFYSHPFGKKDEIICDHLFTTHQGVSQLIWWSDFHQILLLPCISIKIIFSRVMILYTQLSVFETNLSILSEWLMMVSIGSKFDLKRAHSWI